MAHEYAAGAADGKRRVCGFGENREGLFVVLGRGSLLAGLRSSHRTSPASLAMKKKQWHRSSPNFYARWWKVITRCGPMCRSATCRGRPTSSCYAASLSRPRRSPGCGANLAMAERPGVQGADRFGTGWRSRPADRAGPGHPSAPERERRGKRVPAGAGGGRLAGTSPTTSAGAAARLWGGAGAAGSARGRGLAPSRAAAGVILGEWDRPAHVEPDALPLHVIGKAPPDTEREVAEFVARRPALMERYSGFLATLHPSVWKEVEAMAKTKRGGFDFDFEPLIQAVGAKRVIEAVGDSPPSRRSAWSGSSPRSAWTGWSRRSAWTGSSRPSASAA